MIEIYWKKQAKRLSLTPRRSKGRPYTRWPRRKLNWWFAGENLIASRYTRQECSIFQLGKWLLEPQSQPRMQDSPLQWTVMWNQFVGRDPLTREHYNQLWWKIIANSGHSRACLKSDIKIGVSYVTCILKLLTGPCWREIWLDWRVMGTTLTFSGAN